MKPDETEESPRIPRYLPGEPFPRYAYVPGRFPHPTRDPAGHTFGEEAEPSQVLEPERWDRSRPYLRGIDLFNHGYYWEAHEAWESLWQGCGRTGETADFLKALIALAAAGVKIREGQPRGTRRHAARAKKYFERIRAERDAAHDRFMGLSLAELIRFAAGLVEEATLPLLKPR